MIVQIKHKTDLSQPTQYVVMVDEKVAFTEIANDATMFTDIHEANAVKHQIVSHLYFDGIDCVRVKIIN